MPEPPVHVEDLADYIEKIRGGILFNEDIEGIASLPPVAEQHFLMALSHLEIAQREFKLANYHRMRRS